MALNIKNVEVEKLAREVAELSGETKTEAIRRALEERKSRLSMQVGRRRRAERFLGFLEADVWSHAKRGHLGRHLTRAEEDEILGYGPGGA